MISTLAGDPAVDTFLAQVKVAIVTGRAVVVGIGNGPVAVVAAHSVVRTQRRAINAAGKRNSRGSRCRNRWQLLWSSSRRCRGLVENLPQVLCAGLQLLTERLNSTVGLGGALLGGSLGNLDLLLLRHGTGRSLRGRSDVLDGCRVSLALRCRDRLDRLLSLLLGSILNGSRLRLVVSLLGLLSCDTQLKLLLRLGSTVELLVDGRLVLVQHDKGSGRVGEALKDGIDLRRDVQGSTKLPNMLLSICK